MALEQHHAGSLRDSRVSFWQAVKILLLAGILIGGHRAVEVPPSMTADSGSQTTQAE